MKIIAKNARHDECGDPITKGTFIYHGVPHIFEICNHWANQFDVRFGKVDTIFFARTSSLEEGLKLIESLESI